MTSNLLRPQFTAATSNELVNKTYADTKVSKSGDEAIAGVKTFSGNAIFNANVGIGASPTTKLDVIDDGAVMFASSSSVHSDIKSVAGAKLILNNRSLNDDSPSTDETKSHGKIIWAGHNRPKPSAYIEATSDGWDDAGNLKFAVSAGSGGASEKLCIYGSNGFVGIGTTTPSYPLHVHGHVSLSTGNVNFFRGISSGIGHDLTYYNSSTNFTANTGILAEQSIASKGYFLAFSDKRIKKDIVEISDDTALQKIRLLKPSTYKYKDPFSKDEFGIVDGFIAQEVKEVMPHATKILTDYIPNVLASGACVKDVSSNDYFIDFAGFDTSTLELDASNNLFSKLKLYVNDNDTEVIVNIKKIVSTTQIKVETDTSLPSEVVVYGQEVNNVHVLMKDKIFTTAISALQEVDRQLQAEKAKVSALEARISALENPST